MTELQVEAQTQPAVLPKEWLTSEETLDRLKKSASTLERMVASGEVISRLEPMPGRKPMRLYEAASVQRIAGNPRAVRSTQEVAPSKPKLLSLAPDLREFAGELLDRFVSGRDEQAVPLHVKLWLDIDEAHRYSGLSKADLISQRKQGRIVARKSGGWRYLRSSIETEAALACARPSDEIKTSAC